MSQNRPSLVCFPGFLGVPEDFKSFRNITPDLSIVDVCGLDAPKEGQTWQDWENDLLGRLQSQYADRLAIIVGYSMGARIVLNLLRKNLKWIKAAVLLSCHPGLISIEEKEQRAKSDKIWADKLVSESWDDFLAAWNAQVVLQNSNPLHLNKVQFDILKLARVMETFSLAKQQIPDPNSILTPTFLCWGKGDKKFRDLAILMNTQFKSLVSCEIPNSGHRILLDNPGYMLEKLEAFISNL